MYTQSIAYNYKNVYDACIHNVNCVKHLGVPMSINALMGRVRSILQERDISQASFARQIEVSPQTVSAWFSGRNRPGIEEVAKMCKVLHVSPSWLMTGREDAIEHQSLVCEDTICIPILDVRASCGIKEVLNPNAAVVEVMQVTKQWALRNCGGDVNFRALNLITVTGDSMSPTLDDGDLVIIDRSVERFETDSMFVFTIDDGLYIKRIQRIGRKFHVISDNPLYQPYVLEPADLEHGFAVRGRVVTTCNIRKA